MKVLGFTFTSGLVLCFAFFTPTTTMSLVIFFLVGLAISIFFSP